ncbi:Predicted NAD-dependent oxidoreductase [Ceraceosorus bombacis]|uniref:Predicted NAD-dependent oxidoreductase n=1 Tax=Ceraceosorus bombacis TaxID=401625 RepID=A0A0P1BC83_9BASI|nr:Predicted NAD-dependent oxidoreductase [Ceraceosorus bombacis]
MSQNTQIILRERPGIQGTVNPSLESGTFALQKSPIPTEKDVPDGSVLIKVKYVSIDPAMRGWLNDTRSYLPPAKIGDVFRCAALGEIVHSKSPSFTVGDPIAASTGWQQYAILPAKLVEAAPAKKGAELIDYLGVFGSSGLTAYFGLFEVAKAKQGDVVVVTGAAGSVGSIVVQLAKIKGCTVIATAGSDDKVKWLKEELGADDAFSYRSPTFFQDLRNCIVRKHKFAHCVFDNYADKYDAARTDFAKWLGEGKLKRNFYTREGLENAPQALIDLFSGVNKGKMVVKVA